jgi:hypothetical protein
MVVKFEVTVLEDFETSYHLEPAYITYKVPPSTTTTRTTSTPTEEALEDEMYFTELVPATTETVTIETTSTLTISETTKTIDPWRLIATKIMPEGWQPRRTATMETPMMVAVRATKTRTTTEVPSADDEETVLE